MTKYVHSQQFVQNQSQLVRASLESGIEPALTCLLYSPTRRQRNKNNRALDNYEISILFKTNSNPLVIRFDGIRHDYNI
jgi:hypothetical protein